MRRGPPVRQQGQSSGRESVPFRSRIEANRGSGRAPVAEGGRAKRHARSQGTSELEWPRTLQDGSLHIIIQQKAIDESASIRFWRWSHGRRKPEV